MSPTPPDLPILLPHELLARLGGSHEVLAQVATLLAQSAHDWQAELSAAVAADDAERLRRGAHQVKGAMLTAAAPRAAAAAKALEDVAKSGELAGAAEALAKLVAEVDRVEEAVRAMLAERDRG